MGHRIRRGYRARMRARRKPVKVPGQSGQRLVGGRQAGRELLERLELETLCLLRRAGECGQA